MEYLAPGRLYFWEDRALYLGPGLSATVHAHHALQVCLPLSGAVRLRPGPSTTWEEYRGAVIPSNQPHESDVAVELVASLWIEPNAELGRMLVQRRGQLPILRLEDATLDRILPRLRECWAQDFDVDRAGVLLDDALQDLAPPLAPRPVDLRVARALQVLDAAPEHRISWDRVAAAVHLSPSRLAHLFAAATGIPARRYLLWLRLRDALNVLATGATTTEAAHAAGFADGAHLTRTFRRMLGFAPSSFLRLQCGFRRSAEVKSGGSGEAGAESPRTWGAAARTARPARPPAH